MNKPIFIFQKGHEFFGIITVPTFPCGFYAGKLLKTGAEYIPADNSNGFFRTEAECEEEILKFL